MGQQQFVTEDGQPITQEQYQQILAAQQNQMGYEDGMGQEYDDMQDDGGQQYMPQEQKPEKDPIQDQIQKII
jgi:hypothetical protein|tara:strand:- start:4 stop:219 length:216 start_codon:yes stop_codon:yes gene_type:complete